jgi:uroporphyrinogen decarboxylase
MNDRILRALRRESLDYTPVWFMRQAGRCLPRYREARADRAFFEIILDPPAAAEITAMPLDYFSVDAAVLYNDLVTPFFGAGFHVELRQGVGPVVDRPIRTPADADALEPFDVREALHYNMEQIRLLKERLDVPILGFVGAPFTLLSYLVGAPRSRDLGELKSFIWRYPEAWSRLADYWARHLADFGIAQWEAGAGAVQVFDSWAGALGPDEYERHVLPHTRTLLERMADKGVPTINFFNGNPALLPLVAAAGGDAVSVDWRLPINDAWKLVGHDRAIQGNLDPTALLAGEQVALAKAKDVLQRVGGRPGHIFNLGHGILPGTDHNVIAAVADFVHEHSAKILTAGR